jgi:hypothetical protein
LIARRHSAKVDHCLSKPVAMHWSLSKTYDLWKPGSVRQVNGGEPVRWLADRVVKFEPVGSPPRVALALKQKLFVVEKRPKNIFRDLAALVAGLFQPTLQ